MIFLHSGQNQNFFDNNKRVQKSSSEKFSPFICESPVMQGIYNRIKELAYNTESVLILGAQGTGRSTVARQIFNENSLHSLKRNFIEFNLQGHSSYMIHQKLFGDNDSGKGLLALGADNTLFLRGIELLNHSLQKKMITYLLDKKDKNLLPRLICSSSENFPKRVQDSYFSQDLFHLLSGSLLILPLLHERPEDVPCFISLFNKENNFKGRLNYSALSFLQSYRSHNNISELKKICLQISILYSDKKLVTEQDLSYIVTDADNEDINIKYNPNVSLEELNNLYIQKSLEYFKCKKKSSKALGISMKTIYNKIKNGDILPVV